MEAGECSIDEEPTREQYEGETDHECRELYASCEDGRGVLGEPESASEFNRGDAGDGAGNDQDKAHCFSDPHERLAFPAASSHGRPGMESDRDYSIALALTRLECCSRNER